MDGSLLRTPLCDRLGIELPIVQAPIGEGATPELVAAVAGAGALGMLAMSWTEPDAIRSVMQRTKALTPRPFGVNFVLEWDQRERLAICLEEGARIVSYFWSSLAPGSPYVDEAHAAGATVLLTVGSADEAKRAVDAGVDVVVAQGLDAGGHVWGSVGTLSLVPAVVDAAAPTPVIAAGGIGDGRGLAAVLALGAQAAWMGTRFVVADESGTHPDYRDRIVRARETDAVWSRDVFDGGWPDAPVRTLDNARSGTGAKQGPLPLGRALGKATSSGTGPMRRGDRAVRRRPSGVGRLRGSRSDGQLCGPECGSDQEAGIRCRHRPRGRD